MLTCCLQGSVSIVLICSVNFFFFLRERFSATMSAWSIFICLESCLVSACLVSCSHGLCLFLHQQEREKFKLVRKYCRSESFFSNPTACKSVQQAMKSNCLPIVINLLVGVRFEAIWVVKSRGTRFVPHGKGKLLSICTNFPPLKLTLLVDLFCNQSWDFSTVCCDKLLSVD